MSFPWQYQADLSSIYRYITRIFIRLLDKVNQSNQADLQGICQDIYTDLRGNSNGIKQIFQVFVNVIKEDFNGRK